MEPGRCSWCPFSKSGLETRGTPQALLLIQVEIPIQGRIQICRAKYVPKTPSPIIVFHIFQILSENDPSYKLYGIRAEMLQFLRPRPEIKVIGVQEPD